MRPRACWDYWPPTTAKTWRGRWNAPLGYRAFSWSAVERILAAQARPRSVQEALTAEAQQQLHEILRQAPLSARPAAAYQALLEATETGHEKDDDDPHEPTA